MTRPNFTLAFVLAILAALVVSYVWHDPPSVAHLEPLEPNERIERR